MTRLINGMTFKTQFQGKLLITKIYSLDMLYEQKRDKENRYLRR